MVSHMYPNVNKNIFSAASTMPHLTYSSQVEPVPVEEDKELQGQSEKQGRLSAPPPYSEEDPVAGEAGLTRPRKDQTKKRGKKEPSLLLEVALGYRLAKSLTEKRLQRRETRLQRVHDAWMRLGVDTRIVASQGGELPPHFWNPPNYGPEEMNTRLAQICP